MSPDARSTAAADWVAELGMPDDVGLVARIVRLNLFVTKALEGIAADAGLSLGDYLVLGVLRRSPGHRSTPTRVCEVLDRTTGGMTLTLDRLEAAGWLTRSPDAGDRRRVVLELTPRGIAVSAAVNAELHRWEDALALGAGDRDRLARSIDTLLERLAPDGRS
jgi:DNA-binding MarR family transcriptional regulator